MTSKSQSELPERDAASDWPQWQIDASNRPLPIWDDGLPYGGGIGLRDDLANDDVDLQLVEIEERIFDACLNLLGIALRDAALARTIVKSHFHKTCSPELRAELGKKIPRNLDLGVQQVVVAFQRMLLASLRSVWASRGATSELPDDVRLDILGEMFPYEEYYGEDAVDQLCSSAANAQPSAGESEQGLASATEPAGPPRQQLLPLSDSATSSATESLAKRLLNDRPRQALRQHLRVPSRPLRTKSNLDGPNARVAAASDLTRFFEAGESAKGTRLFGVMPIVEVDEFENDEFQEFAVTAPARMTLEEEVRARHLLAIGPTGCGKTSKLILPLLASDLADRTRSTIVLDSKAGELLPFVYAVSVLHRHGRKVWVLDFRHPDRSDAWNPLHLLDTFPKVRTFSHRLCYAAETRLQSADSEFWIRASIKSLAGIFWALKTDSQESFAVARAQEIVEMSTPQIKTWAAQYPRINGLQSLIEFLETGSHNAHTILTDLQNRLALWSDEDICRVTSTAELDLTQILSEPSVLVVRLNESDVGAMRQLTNALFSELVTILFRIAEASPGGKLPLPVSLHMEEFASAIGRIPEFSRFINVVRSRGVSVTATAQSISQIEYEYGAECGSVLAGFCTKIFFPGLTLKDAEYASELFGNMTVEHREQSVFRDEVASYSRDVGHSQAVKIVKRPIFTPHEIRSPLRHQVLGGAVTFDLPDTPPFQAFLCPAFELESLSEVLSSIAQADQLGHPRAPGGGRLPTGRHDEPATRQPFATLPPGISDTRGWSEDKLKTHLERLKTESLGWSISSPSARGRWEAFANKYKRNLPQLIRLAEELKNRQASILEYFQACDCSGSKNAAANLHFLDYLRFKCQEESKKRKHAEETAEGISKRSDMVLIHCPGCRSLVPGNRVRCTMCGTNLRSGE